MSTPAPRNPMLRTSDRVQRWLTGFLLACVLVGVPSAAVATGVWTYRTQLHAARIQTAARHAVTARLTEDAPAVSAPGSTAVPGTVTWTTPDGGRHSARIAVPPGSRAGTPVRLWIDAGGAVVSAPATRGRAVTTALTAAALAAGGGAVLCLAVWKGSVRLLDRHRYARWDAEWAQIEPRWSRGLPG